MAQTAHTKAKTLLAGIYKEELRGYYLEEKAKLNPDDYPIKGRRNALARSRALTKLSKNHRMHYLVVYTTCLVEGYSNRSKPKTRNHE